MYKIVYGLLYAVSLLPWRVLYILSNVITFIVEHIIKYRRDVVYKNIKNAFPEKSTAEIKKIAHAFYINFVDSFVETIKLISASQEKVNKRCTGNFEVINEAYKTGKNAEILLCHSFNWEIANAYLPTKIHYPMVTVYMPLTNKIMNRLFIHLRTKFGALVVPATNFKKKFASFINNRYALALVADQSPGGPDDMFWTNFFHRITPFVKGPEKGAHANDTIVILCAIQKIKRGRYHLAFELLTEQPRTMPAGSITKTYVEFAERNITLHPDNYLWSHRRWKWQFEERFRDGLL